METYHLTYRAAISVLEHLQYNDYPSNTSASGNHRPDENLSVLRDRHDVEKAGLNHRASSFMQLRT